MVDQRFIFRNGSKNIELENVVAIEGFGIPPTLIDGDMPGWRRDGITVHWVGYTERPFTIEFDFSAHTSEAAAAQRRELMRFFADKGARSLECVRYDGTVLTLSPVYIAAPSMHPLYQSPYLEEIIQFIAGNPYFQRKIAPSALPLETPLLEWPEYGLEWVDGGIEFSSAENEITIYNYGDVISDAIVRFDGPAVTPYIHNKTTDQKATVNRTLSADEVLEINSATGRVDIVEDDGTRNNAFNYMTPDSELINFAPGLNTLEFGSAGGGGTVTAEGVEYYVSL